MTEQNNYGSWIVHFSPVFWKQLQPDDDIHSVHCSHCLPSSHSLLHCSDLLSAISHIYYYSAICLVCICPSILHWYQLRILPAWTLCLFPDSIILTCPLSLSSLINLLVLTSAWLLSNNSKNVYVSVTSVFHFGVQVPLQWFRFQQ